MSLNFYTIKVKGVVSGWMPIHYPVGSPTTICKLLGKKEDKEWVRRERESKTQKRLLSKNIKNYTTWNPFIIQIFGGRFGRLVGFSVALWVGERTTSANACVCAAKPGYAERWAFFLHFRLLSTYTLSPWPFPWFNNNYNFPVSLTFLVWPFRSFLP